MVRSGVGCLGLAEIWLARGDRLGNDEDLRAVGGYLDIKSSTS